MTDELKLEVGKHYYRKIGLHGTVKRLDELYENKKTGRKRCRYTVTFCSGSKKQEGVSRDCNLNGFRRWATGCFDDLEIEDPSELHGCWLYKNYVIQDASGKPALNCSEKRAGFYLKKGFATRIDETTIRLTNNQAIEVLEENYGSEFRSNPFFLAEKNTHCVVCGKTTNLTRHHIVPKRYKKKLPQEVRVRLSNVLFVCITCHNSYEEGAPEADEEIAKLEASGNDPVRLAEFWGEHFIRETEPKFMHEGWSLVMMPRKLSS